MTSVAKSWCALLVAPVVAVAVGACSAERAVPSAAPTSGPVASQPAGSTSSAPATTVAEAPPSTTRRTTTTAAPTTTTTTEPIPADRWVAFDKALATEMLAYGDHAVSVAVGANGELLHQAAFGVRIPTPPPGWPVAPGSLPAASQQGPAEPEHRFRIASLSKLITGIVVLQLVEDGQLRLDEPVGGRLARRVGAEVVDPAISAITVRQLLSHTAGFNEYEATFFGGLVGSCPEAAQRGLSRTLDAPPGTAYVYSNMSFCLLGLLIEDVTRQPYEQAARERLLQPLGIDGMRLAGTFDARRGEVVHLSIPTRNYMEALGGAGSWVGTASDVVRILQSLDHSSDGWHPLSRRTVELMQQPAPPPVVHPPLDPQWYGLGLMVWSDGSYGHTGTIESTHAMVVHRPDGVTWSVLVSGEYPSDTQDLRTLLDAALVTAGISLA